jgi:hypothetical protein
LEKRVVEMERYLGIDDMVEDQVIGPQVGYADPIAKKA